MFKFSQVLLAFTIVATSAVADGAKPLPAPIEQCIRDNAAKVEAAVPDLNRAVDFLVEKVCAEPIAEEGARVSRATQERTAAQWKKMCDDETAVAKSGPGKGDNAPKDVDYCAMTKVGFLMEPGTGESTDVELSYDISTSGSGPPAAIALASRLLLDLRLSHLSHGN